MHFQVIKDDYYNSILQRLREFVPEFKSTFDEDDGIYPILGDLGNFLVDNAKNEKIVKKVMLFASDALENGGKETENAIILQVFDKFYEEIGSIDDLEKKLPKNIRKKIEKYKFI